MDTKQLLKLQDRKEAERIALLTILPQEVQAVLN
jgi:hypothetical protein